MDTSLIILNSRLTHVAGIYFFTKGFLLTRLVLDERSTCTEPPIAITPTYNGVGTHEAGCWHPKTFDKAIVIIVDALRYDFTVPITDSNGSPSTQAYHNAFPFLYETAVNQPHNAFLLPFIADPPTTTLQRLNALTTGTLPVFLDAGSNFGGTAIQEDNLLQQLRDAGKKIVHLGDDTWTALFPGYFEDDISRAYPSLDVWDLHTLDNGVNEHIFPLITSQNSTKWDVMFAHYLGVDHAGHRYGPNHPAMTAKLQQTNDVIQRIAREMDDNTLLVVMGDHGMDAKGDHGGESDDEVEAALWMYSRKGVFGRTDPTSNQPPQTAKERPVNQIDFVPTLALLLGLPIPFNSLGKPIAEAFIGRKGKAWDNLAAVARVASAGIKRYQAAYYKARNLVESGVDGSPLNLWAKAENATVLGEKHDSQSIYEAFSAYQQETLSICRGLWARFDVPSMVVGIMILAGALLSLLLYANTNTHREPAPEAIDTSPIDIEAEFRAIQDGTSEILKEQTNSRDILQGGLIGVGLGALAWPAIWLQLGGESIIDFAIGISAATGILGVLYKQMRPYLETFGNPLPTTLWGWMSVIFTVAQAIGFASNSYTIWEDSILLFFITTFGIMAAASSLRIEGRSNRILGIYHSLAFVVLGWIASFSKLCREEQMPYCKSSFYASATSSTSAPWQLLIPVVVAGFLPAIIKSYYVTSRSYEGFAPIWIGWVFRSFLVVIAIFWTMDAADDGDWLANVSWIRAGLLKTLRVPLAQSVFAVAIGVGTTAFIYAPPCISIHTTPPPNTTGGTVVETGKGPQVTILGYANAFGTRYFLLVTNILLCILMVAKPMGGGALALMTWQILSLLEVLDLNNLTASPIGPVVLALLGSFHFFKTGHQAALSSIQWESAFIASSTIKYPYSPILITLNTYGSHILAAISVPLVVLWKQEPRKKGLLKSMVRAASWHVAYYATIGLATTMWAGWLRRHLMLYRIFSPRFMMGALALVVVDLVMLVSILGFRRSVGSVGEIFGWA